MSRQPPAYSLPHQEFAVVPSLERVAGASPKRRLRVPLNVFGVAFGLAGLATAWRVAVDESLAPQWVSDTLVVLAAAVWAVSCAAYLRYALAGRRLLSRDLHDTTVGPFASLALITPILLAADGVDPYVRPLAAGLVDTFAVGVVLLGGWLTGYWMRGGIKIDRLHPGYFLPTVAGGFVASAGAAEVGQRRFAEVLFGLGLVCWLVLGSMILARLFFRPPLPQALIPTMALELAPPAVGSVAYLFAHEGRLDSVAAALAGYGLLMVAAQLPLLPSYFRLPFSLGTWAFAFSWAAVASTTLLWIAAGHPPGGRAYSYLTLAAISALIGAIATRTIVALARRQLFPIAAPAHAAATDAAVSSTNPSGAASPVRSTAESR